MPSRNGITISDCIATVRQLRERDQLLRGQRTVAADHRREPRALEVLERHRGQAGIIYCSSRKEVDAIAQWLQDTGWRARPYHAGMADDERHANQDAFLNEEIDLVVATVAFVLIHLAPGDPASVIAGPDPRVPLALGDAGSTSSRTTSATRGLPT